MNRMNLVYLFKITIDCLRYIYNAKINQLCYEPLHKNPRL